MTNVQLGKDSFKMVHVHLRSEHNNSVVHTKTTIRANISAVWQLSLL
jgi:hypothetical protein